ncbi:hypothetical protein Tco_0587113, partial [Tanacetum coccineum]
MDDSNMTMEEYIVFEEEKSRRHLGYVDAEFPAIVIDDTVTPKELFHANL